MNVVGADRSPYRPAFAITGQSVLSSERQAVFQELVTVTEEETGWHAGPGYFLVTSQNRSTHTYFTWSGFLAGAAHKYTSPWSFVLPSL